MDKEMEDLNNSLPLILVSQKELDVLQAEVDELATFIDNWRHYYPPDIMEAAIILIDKHRGK